MMGLVFNYYNINQPLNGFHYLTTAPRIVVATIIPDTLGGVKKGSNVSQELFVSSDLVLLKVITYLWIRDHSNDT